MGTEWRMEWDKLLSEGKLLSVVPDAGQTGSEAENEQNADAPKAVDSKTHLLQKYEINPFEMDYNQIVTSAAFRRLQDKTQVFPLSKSDFVRTRLTHSIEVSTIAFQMGQMLTEIKPSSTGSEKDQKVQAELNPYKSQIPAVLRCAGLIHDLGNPPFGHFGEETIGSWFRKNLDRVQYKGEPLRKWLTKREAADLEHFEGNAQALRLLCKARQGGEIDVSYAVISALVKYPTTSLEFDHDDPDIKRHKPGVFEAEDEIFQKVSEAVGTRNAKGEYFRHPLTYLMEAADDIAYVTSDLEDAFKKRYFTLDQFSKFCNGEAKNYKGKGYKQVQETFEQLDAERAKTESEEAAFSAWLHYVRFWLMYEVVGRFLYKDQKTREYVYDDIMEGKGNCGQELFKGTFHEQTVEILRGVMGKYVYDKEALVRSEISGQTIISFLLDGFVKAVLYVDKEHRGDEDEKKHWTPTQVDRKYYELISERFRNDYEKTRTGTENKEAYKLEEAEVVDGKRQINDLYLRLLMVTDQISGMTDAYARDLFRELRGVE